MKTQNNNLVEARKNDRAELVTIHHNMCTCVHVHRLQGTVHTHTDLTNKSKIFASFLP